MAYDEASIYTSTRKVEVRIEQRESESNERERDMVTRVKVAGESTTKESELTDHWALPRLVVWRERWMRVRGKILNIKKKL